MGLAEVLQEAARNPELDVRRRTSSGLHEILDARRLAWPGLGVLEHVFVEVRPGRDRDQRRTQIVATTLQGIPTPPR